MENSGKQPYIKDGELYSIWKYLNSARLVKRGCLRFDDLIPIRKSSLFVATFLDLLKRFGIDHLEKPNFNQDVYYCFHEKSITDLREHRRQGRLSKFELKTLEYMERFLNGDFSLLYDETQGIHALLFLDNILGLLEFIEFSGEIPPEGKKKLTRFIDDYSANFIDDSLIKDKDNFYHFQKQRQLLLHHLAQYQSEYGNEFILEYPDTPFDDEHYLFIHTLVVLEKMGYIHVEDIWIFDMDLSPEEQTERYKIKLRLKDQYFDLVEGNKNLSDNKTFWFDNKTFKFKITDGSTKAINLSPTKTQGSDPYLLMRAWINLLQKEGKRVGQWLEVCIRNHEVMDELLILGKKGVNENWLKNTKANLKKNLPIDINGYIEISDFKRKEGYFIFRLKLPA